MTHATAPIPALEQRLLADRIRQCVPLRHPAFGKLLQLLSIEATDTVATAAVTVGARSRMLINPAFVAQRCRTDAHLSMLVMHELYHVLLGHTRMYQRPTLAANWAFDCVINAQLCRLHPDVEFTSFFSSCAAPEGLWSLIGPPAGWPAAARYAPGALGDVHRRLYDDASTTTADLFALLDTMAEALDADGADRLLGNHGNQGSHGDDGDHGDHGQSHTHQREADLACLAGQGLHSRIVSGRVLADSPRPTNNRQPAGQVSLCTISTNWLSAADHPASKPMASWASRPAASTWCSCAW